MGEGSSAGVKNIKKVFRHPDGYGAVSYTHLSYLQIVTLPKEYTALMKLEEGKKVFGFHYLGYDSTDELVEYTDAYYLPKYTSFKYVAQRG